VVGRLGVRGSWGLLSNLEMGFLMIVPVESSSHLLKAPPRTPMGVRGGVAQRSDRQGLQQFALEPLDECARDRGAAVDELFEQGGGDAGADGDLDLAEDRERARIGRLA